MGITLIVIGIVVAYLCWVTKKGSQYIEARSEGIVKRRQVVELKLQTNQKLTKIEWFDWYSAKIGYGFLTFCIYIGLIASFAGFILALMGK